jgi:hypothetical protein
MNVPTRPPGRGRAAALDDVALYVARSMIHGNYAERDRAYSLAQDVEPLVPGFTDQVKEAISRCNRDPWMVWNPPKETADDPAVKLDIKSLTSELARHIAGAYISGGDDQVARARELETALDGLGLNIDRKVDSIVLEEMRNRPSTRGTGGRADGVPF